MQLDEGHYIFITDNHYAVNFIGPFPTHRAAYDAAVRFEQIYSSDSWSIMESPDVGVIHPDEVKGLKDA